VASKTRCCWTFEVILRWGHRLELGREQNRVERRVLGVVDLGGMAGSGPQPYHRIGCRAGRQLGCVVGCETARTQKPAALFRQQESQHVKMWQLLD
jgi:hypothetical protein